MKLISCHIDAFGKFKNFDIDFNDKLTVICAKNGYGKTTIAEFIKAMFYSLPANSKRQNYKSERDLYRPFDFEGKFGGRLTFSCKKGNYTIVRQFGRTPTLDKFYLFNADTNLISDDFSSNIGDELLGVGVETFDNSTFFSQNNLISGINDDIRANLSVGVLSGDDLDNFEKAQSQIQKKLKEYRADIRELNIESISEDYERCKAKEEVLNIKLNNSKRELKDIDLKKKTFKKSNTIIDKNQASKLINQNIGLESIIDSDNEKILAKEREKAELLKDKKLTKGEANFVRNNYGLLRIREVKKISIIMAFLLVLGVAGMIYGIFSKVNNFFIAGAVILVISSLVEIYAFYVNFKYSEEKHKYNNLLKDKGLNKKTLQIELEKVGSISSDISFIDDEIRKLKLEVEKCMMDSKTLQKKFEINFGRPLKSFYNTDDDRDSALLSIEKREIELKNDLKHYLDDLEQLQEKIFVLNDMLNSNMEKKGIIEKNIELLNKVSEHLVRSRDNVSNRFIDPVSQRFNRYYKKFIEDGDKILIDSNLGIRFGNHFSEADYLSAGLFDLVYICKRFALVDLIYKKEKPVLVLDDPFSNFDDDKLEISKEIISELKDDYQIILFTCQKARA